DSFIFILFIYWFFFSSRRRHTRCYRDWSSDVCSSDLLRKSNSPVASRSVRFLPPRWELLFRRGEVGRIVMPLLCEVKRNLALFEIGRASCREKCSCCGWWCSGEEKGLRMR